MKTCFLSLALTLLLGNLQARAVDLVFDFSTNNVPLYDSGGTFSTNLNGMQEDYTIAISPKGKINGSFTAFVDDGTAYLNFTGAISGVVRGSAVVLTPDDFRMSMNLRARFSGTINGTPVKGVETARSLLKPDSSMQYLIGDQHITVCIAGHGCRQSVSSVQVPVSNSSGASGAWLLALSVTNNSNKISGTAVVTLENSREFDFKVRGAFSTAKNISRLVLTGTGEAAGTKLTMELSPDNELISIRGRLLGQRFDWRADL
ncbi:MAG TPA: hypothetical protein VK530_05085 [Candidatus Acidoferrum sp.]|nr:hypothetical protein [Candidatus Acidoferrum sp.]